MRLLGISFLEDKSFRIFTFCSVFFKGFLGFFNRLKL